MFEKNRKKENKSFEKIDFKFEKSIHHKKTDKNQMKKKVLNSFSLR